MSDYKTIYMPYRNFAERTREEYLNDLMGFIRYAERLGISAVAGIGLPVIHRYIAQLEDKGFSSLTRKRKVVAIRSLLGFLHEDGYIGTDVASKVVVPFTESLTPHILTKSESKRLELVSLGNPRDFAIIELVLQTGIRLSELVRLSLDDIELGNEEGSLRILASHTRKERTVPLNLRGRVALRHYLHTPRDVQSGALFRNRFGEPLGERGIQKMIRRYLRLADIPGASIHTLRHTFGVREAAKGTKLQKLKDLMGLRDTRSTSVYRTTR